MEDSKTPDDLLRDPLLRDAPTVEGFKVLEPAVLYARIGAGGMGAVYRGRHFKLDLDVAVKCLKPALAFEDPDFVKRFEREARLAASIGHQNVVRVMDVQEKNGLHYLVMEFVRGETATERVRRKGPLAEAEALAIMLGVTAGLAEAHARGIVHRDIKPDNVLISLEGRVKLADLGLAKSSGGIDGRSVSMAPSRIMGTPQYMPPEQWKTTDVGPAADVWALGAMFAFLVTGEPSFPGQRRGQPDFDYLQETAKRIQEHDFPSWRAQRPELRDEVQALFERCVQRDPAARFVDARALLKALRKLAIDDEDVLLDPATGSGSWREGTLTPPPKQTLLRIKAQIETIAMGRATEPEPAGGFASRTEANTKESVGGQARQSGPASGAARPASAEPSAVPRRRREPELQRSSRGRWIAAAVLTLGLVLATGYAAGWFASPPPVQPPLVAAASAKKPIVDPGKEEVPAAGSEKQPPTPTDPKAEARAALAKGKALLPQRGQLDAAITALEDALRLDADLADVKVPLAGALAQKAKDLGESDLDRAFGLCTRAAALKPGDGVLLARHEELRSKLAARLAAGLAVTAPKAGAFVTSRQVLLEGKADSPNLRAVRFALVPGKAAPATFPSGSTEASVVAGEWSGPGMFAVDGEHVLCVEAEDGNGVKAQLPTPVRVVVDTQDPVLLVQQPLSNGKVGAKVAVGGKVTDAQVCTVTVNGQPATVDGERWSLELVLRDGAQELLVEAKDAAGRAAVPVKRAIVVDAVPPGLTLAALPKVTKDAQITVSGTVVDLGAGELRVDGKLVTPGADGSFAVPVALGKDQAYAIEVEAKDGLGNRSSQQVAVRRDTVAPVVEWTQPDASQPVREGEVEVSGTVADESGVAAVTVNGQAAVLRGSGWSAKVTVAAGKDFVVTVVGVDEVGNRAQPLTRTLRGAAAFGEKVETGIGLTMIRIEPKPFTMGSPAGESGRDSDELQHRVTISKPYWIGETEVTQGQWKAVMGAKSWSGDYDKVGDRYPATQVSWTDAVAFCAEMTKRERAAGRLPPGYEYTLPSEAEWEYACRGGSTTAYCYGDDERRLAEYAVFGKELNPGNSVDPVRNKKPNAFGLYDMHGNVLEWCADYANYGNGVETDCYRDGVTDPLCLSGAQRVVRGGGWFFGPAGCRSADRFSDDPSGALECLGFRPALVARPPVK